MGDIARITLNGFGVAFLLILAVSVVGIIVAVGMLWYEQGEWPFGKSGT